MNKTIHSVIKVVIVYIVLFVFGLFVLGVKYLIYKIEPTTEQIVSFPIDCMVFYLMINYFEKR